LPDEGKVNFEDEWWIENTHNDVRQQSQECTTLDSITRDFVYYEGSQKNVKGAMKMSCINLNFALPSIIFNDLILVL
jgi:hypothetical protein